MQTWETIFDRFIRRGGKKGLTEEEEWVKEDNRIPLQHENKWKEEIITGEELNNALVKMIKYSNNETKHKLLNILNTERVCTKILKIKTRMCKSFIVQSNQDEVNL